MQFDRRWSRRRVLESVADVSVVALATSLLVACSSSTPAPSPQAGAQTAPTAPPASTSAASKPVAAPTPAAAKAAASPAANAPGSANAVQIITLQRNIPQDVKFMEAEAKKFTDANPSIQVKVEVMPDNYLQVRQARIAAGTAGDLARSQMNTTYATDALLGLLKQIDEYVKKDNYDLKQHLQFAVDGLTIKGKLYCLPWNCHPGWSAIFYMKDLFDAGGVNPPTSDWTYDDMITAAQKLTKSENGKPSQYGLWVSPSIPALLTPTSALGGWYQTADGTKATWTDPKTVAGIQWVTDVYQKWKVSPANPAYNSRADLWSSKKVAMVFSGVWEVAYLGQIAPKGTTWAVAPGPKGTSGKRGGMLNVNLFPIWASTKHPDEAWVWHKFLSSKQSGLDTYDAGLEPGARGDVWSDPKIQSDPKVKPFADLINDSKPMVAPANGRLAEMLDGVNKVLQLVYIGEKQVAAGANEMQLAAQKVMDEAPPGG